MTTLEQRPSLADQWDLLAAKVLPRGAPRVQRLEMRRAFYAGAAAWSSLMLNYLSDGDEPTADDLRYMTALHAELERFSALVRAGLA